MTQYYQARDLPVAHTVADADAEAKRFREIEASFALLPNEQSIKRDRTTVYTTSLPEAGMPDVWTATPVVPLSTPLEPDTPYTDGQLLRFRTPGVVPGPVSLAIAGRPRVPLLDSHGNPLVSGALEPATFVSVHYDLTQGAFVLGPDGVQPEATVVPGSITPDKLDAGTPEERAAFRDALGLAPTEAEQVSSLGVIEAPVATVGVPGAPPRSAAFTLSAPVDFGPFPVAVGTVVPPSFRFLDTVSTEFEVGPLPGPATTVLGAHSAVHEHPEDFPGGSFGQLPGGVGVAPHMLS